MKKIVGHCIDVPLHIEYAKKEEADPRRHKSRCIFNDGKRCKSNYSETGWYCFSSSHCKYYCESLDDFELQQRENRFNSYRNDAGTIYNSIREKK